MKILAMDVESCTGRFTNASMCSFGYCLSDEKFNIITQEDILMNPVPKKFFSGMIQSIDITLAYPEETFRSMPRFPHYYEKIKSLFEDALVIGFAVENDVRYLNNACDYFQLERIKYKFLDVQTLHRVVNGLKTVSALSKACEPLGEEFVMHRSDEDAKMTLLLLKYLCEQENATIEEIVEKYCMNYGENLGGDVQQCSCYLDELEKRSKDRVKNKNILLHGFIEKLPRIKYREKTEFTKKAVCFELELQNEDIDKMREIISKLHTLGGRYVTSITQCDIYVVKTLEECENLSKDAIVNDLGRCVTVMPLEEFGYRLGDVPKLDFSADAIVLQKHYDKVDKNKLQNKKRRKAKYYRMWKKGDNT